MTTSRTTCTRSTVPARVYPEQLTCSRICEKLVELLEKIVLQSGPEYSENKEDTTLSLMIAPLATTATECSENKKDTTLSLMIAPLATTATSPPSLYRRRRRLLPPRRAILNVTPTARVARAAAEPFAAPDPRHRRQRRAPPNPPSSLHARPCSLVISSILSFEGGVKHVTEPPHALLPHR